MLALSNLRPEPEPRWRWWWQRHREATSATSCGCWMALARISGVDQMWCDSTDVGCLCKKGRFQLGQRWRAHPDLAYATAFIDGMW